MQAVTELPKTFKQLVKQVAEKETVMLLGNDDEVTVAKMCAEYGPKAGALMLAALNYFKKHNVIYTLAEGFACYREALRINTKKDKAIAKLIEVLEETAHNAPFDLYWTTDHYNVHDYDSSTFKERQNKWPIKMDVTDPNDFLSLGNMLIYTAISGTDFNKASNGEKIAMQSAARYLRRVQKELDICPKQK